MEKQKKAWVAPQLENYGLAMSQTKSSLPNKKLGPADGVYTACGVSVPVMSCSHC